MRSLPQNRNLENGYLYSVALVLKYLEFEHLDTMNFLGLRIQKTRNVTLSRVQNVMLSNKVVKLKLRTPQTIQFVIMHECRVKSLLNQK